MLITVACPSCGRRYDVPGRLAGKRVRCKECATTFRMPVPVTMPVVEPETRKRARHELKEDSLAELLDSPAASPGPVAVVSRQMERSGDLGNSRGYRIFPWLAIAAFGTLWSLRWGSPLKLTITCCVLVGCYLLIPIMANWRSFEETRRTRWLSAAVGLETARAIQATAAIALWVFALLIGMDTIHIAAFDPAVPIPNAPRSTPSE